MFKTTGRMPQQLQDAPEPPEEMMYLAQWYSEVCDGDGLTFQKVHAWSELMRRNIAAWEVKALFAIDRAYWTIKGEVK